MSTILFEKIDGIAKITLNRPKVYNSFNREMALALQERLDECQTDKGIRAVYLTGAGKAFCAGQDIQEITSDNPPPLNKILEEHFNPVVKKLRLLQKPVVCAINGVAAGAGANIALACDVTIASDTASFIQAFSKIGLIPDSGGTYTLVRNIGFQRASALMMLGDKVSAAEAVEMGMIYKAYPLTMFEAEAWKIARKLAHMPTTALWLTKKALNASFENSFDEQLALESDLQTTSANTSDYKEGINSFIEKRQANFTGK